MQRRIADIKKDIAAHSARSTWDRGVKGYAVELFDDRGFPCLIVDAEDIRCDTGAEIDVFLSLRRNERCILSAGKGNGKIRVRFGMICFV